MTEPPTGNRSRRSVLEAAAWVVVLLIAAFVAVAMRSVEASNRRLADGQDAQATVISKLSSGLDTTRRQLQQHGVTPSAPPAQSIVRGVPGVPGVPGAQGIPGAQGAQGVPGPASTVPGPRGPQGVPGPASTVPGPMGPPGAPGADSTVPGPAGPAGKDGKDGRDGADGTNGKDGSPGQPPAGWTWTDPAGVTYSCSPVANFDPAAPRYQCTADSSPAPTPSPSPSTSPPGLLPDRRRT